LVAHRQTVLGYQPLKQTAHGAFPISACIGVQHGKVRAPQSRDHDCHREGGRCSGCELQGQQNIPDRHQFCSNSDIGSAQVAEPQAIARRPGTTTMGAIRRLERRQGILHARRGRRLRRGPTAIQHKAFALLGVTCSQ
jgi:hypothetical protein